MKLCRRKQVRVALAFLIVIAACTQRVCASKGAANGWRNVHDDDEPRKSSRFSVLRGRNVFRRARAAAAQIHEMQLASERQQDAFDTDFVREYLAHRREEHGVALTDANRLQDDVDCRQEAATQQLQLVDRPAADHGNDALEVTVLVPVKFTSVRISFADMSFGSGADAELFAVDYTRDAPADALQPQALGEAVPGTWSAASTKQCHDTLTASIPWAAAFVGEQPGSALKLVATDGGAVLRGMLQVHAEEPNTLLVGTGATTGRQLDLPPHVYAMSLPFTAALPADLMVDNPAGLPLAPGLPDEFPLRVGADNDLQSSGTIARKRRSNTGTSNDDLFRVDAMNRALPGNGDGMLAGGRGRLPGGAVAP